MRKSFKACLWLALKHFLEQVSWIFILHGNECDIFLLHNENPYRKWLISVQYYQDNALQASSLCFRWYNAKLYCTYKEIGSTCSYIITTKWKQLMSCDKNTCYIRNWCIWWPCLEQPRTVVIKCCDVYILYISLLNLSNQSLNGVYSR